MLPVIATVASRYYPLLFKGEWNPTKIDGCVLWLRADSLSLGDGQQVETWYDESGEGNDVTQGTASKRPVFKTGILNGYPVVRFDGEDDWLACTSMAAISQPDTLFVVGKTVDSATYYCFGGAYTTVHNFYLTNAGAILMNAGANLTGLTDVSGAYHYFTCEFNTTSSTARYDGTEDRAGDVGANQLDDVVIGAQDSTNWPLSGDIAEFIIYDNLVSTGDRTTIEEYLADKYGL